MAVAVYIQRGGAIDYTPVVAVPAGTVVVQEDLVGISRLDIPAGKLGALAVEGVFEFPVQFGDGIEYPVGTVMYWDVAQEFATETAVGNKLIGKVTRFAGEGDTRVQIRLSQ